jgi:flagellar motility protein MotE (MotC chaperone)
MDIRARDLIGVGIVSLLLFPIVFFAVLLVTGTARLEVSGLDEETKKKIAGYLERHTPEQEAQDLEQSKLYEANRRLAIELEEKQQELRAEAARLELLKLENSQKLAKISENREEIDKRVGESQAKKKKKIEELAQVYAAMKPVEAAPILMNLDDDSIARILKRVPDSRSQGKLLAAVGALSTKRAASVTKILGWKEKGL